MMSGLRLFTTCSITLLALGLAFPACNALAGGTHRREILSSDEFSQGELDGLAIREEGGLVPGRQLEAMDNLGRAVWSAVAAPGGRDYFATADPAGTVLMENQG